MVRSLRLGRPGLLVCVVVGALLVGAVIGAWVLAHREMLVPVSGRITLDGKPLRSGFVIFYPNHSKGNSSLLGAIGKIQDGRYALWRYDKKEVRKGVPPGWYRVVVEGFAASDRRTAAKTSQNGGFVTKVTVHGSADQKALLTPPPPGDPKDFFSNYNKPQAVEVTKTGAEESYDLVLTRPARQRQHLRRQ